MNNIFEISQIFLGALIVGFSGAVVPGPMFTMVVTSVAKNGFKASVFIVIGHALTELVILILFLAGILKYLQNEIVTKVIGIAGGVALLYLSFELIYSASKNKIKISFKKENLDKKEYNKNTGFSFFQGIFVSVINPYWYIWWVTIGAAFLLKSIKYKIFGVSFFYIGHISSDFIWYLIIGFLVSKGRKFINEKVYKTIIILCGIFLLYLGIKFIIDFIKR